MKENINGLLTIILIAAFGYLCGGTFELLLNWIEDFKHPFDFKVPVLSAISTLIIAFLAE